MSAQRGRTLWRFRTHKDMQPMHATGEDEYVALCGFSFKHVQSSATINPELHDEFHLRCLDCVALLAQQSTDLDAL